MTEFSDTCFRATTVIPILSGDVTGLQQLCDETVMETVVLIGGGKFSMTGRRQVLVEVISNNEANIQGLQRTQE